MCQSGKGAVPHLRDTLTNRSAGRSLKTEESTTRQVSHTRSPDAMFVYVLVAGPKLLLPDDIEQVMNDGEL